VGTKLGVIFLYDVDNTTSIVLHTPSVSYTALKITFSKTGEYFFVALNGAPYLLYGANTGSKDTTALTIDLTKVPATPPDGGTTDVITAPMLLDVCMYSIKGVCLTIMQNMKQYYAINDNLPNGSFKYYDLEVPTEGETYVTCFPYGADYYSDRGIPIFVHDLFFKVQGESRWRELPIVAGYVDLVSNKFVQITSTNDEEEVCVSDNVLHITSGTDERQGIPPEKVFRNYEEENERVQLRGDAEGDNSIAIESGDIAVEENSVVIGKVTNNILQLGQLEFIVLEDRLVVKSRPTKKSLDLLYEEAPGPS
jgi:hypothetical protein